MALRAPQAKLVPRGKMAQLVLKATQVLKAKMAQLVPKDNKAKMALKAPRISAEAP